MNHDLFSASFRYALKYENSFQIHCNALIWLKQGRSDLLESLQTRERKECNERELIGVRGDINSSIFWGVDLPSKTHFLHS